jgi:hypothetical protein
MARRAWIYTYVPLAKAVKAAPAELCGMWSDELCVNARSARVAAGKGMVMVDGRILWVSILCEHSAT